MAILRYSQGKFVLVVVCFLSLLITSKRLTEWSLRSSSLGVPSIRRPYSTSHGNSSSFDGDAAESIDLALPPARIHGLSCDSFPDASNILVVVKTGASESYAKIPTQLVTVLNCVPDFLIFSDMEQDIAGYHVYDSLDTVLPQVKLQNPDFDLYNRQKKCVVDQQSCSVDISDSEKPEGWMLDRYKNVHILEKTYKLRPNHDWYLFIDADTYVLWNNLVEWLSRLEDPSTKKHYIGSVSLIDDFSFAHGGSGYILSQATMQGFAANNSGIANHYDQTARELCCGDYVLALALNDTIGIGVEQAWPTINGEKPYTIPYGSREWCHPIVTMHHMDPEEISSFWKFEKRFYKSHESPRPVIRFKDIYEEFVKPKLLPERYDWDNLSEDVLYLDPNHPERYTQKQKDKDRTKKLMKQYHIPAVERDAYKSFKHCSLLCSSVRSCLQFSYHNGACAYNKSFRFGKPAKKTDKMEERWMSGWEYKRIYDWTDEHRSCKEPIWPNIR
ncbi:glycosyltransferase family 31 protein [Hypoxylon sp. NC0597]|nr:glycosyltransferase family 31 protein [Hypoxylon sp. NC0597]